MQLNQEVDWRVSIREQSKGDVIKKEEAGLHTICTHCQDPYLEQGKTLPFSWDRPGNDPAIPWVWGMGVLGMAMFMNEHECSFLQRYPHSSPYWFSKHVFYVHVCGVCVHTLPFQTLSQGTWSLSRLADQWALSICLSLSTPQDWGCRYTYLCLALFMGAGDLTLESYTFTTSPSPTELS